MKKIANISGQLKTVKRIICMDNEFQPDASLASGSSSSWTVTSFLDLDKMGSDNPVEPNLPTSAEIAVIMYTSGSTGMPKVSMIFCSFSNSYVSNKSYVQSSSSLSDICVDCFF